MPSPIDLDLLKKFLRQECTPEELEKINLFMQQPGYRETMEALLDQEWDQFDPPASDASVTAAWKAAFEEKYSAQKRSAKVKKLRWVAYAAAACMIPLAIMVVPVWQQKRNRPSSGQMALHELRNPKGRTATIRLSDSSVITLGPGSRIQYPASFSDSLREIILEGEAFFEVTRDAHRPFVVRTGAVHTHVLGTSFKIDALPQQPVQVAVATGKVKVSQVTSTQEKQLALLTPGQQAIYDTQHAQLELRELNANDISSWKEGILSFPSMPLAQILAELERWYNVRLTVVSADLGTKKIKLVVNGKKPVTEALETIQQLTQLHYKKLNGTIQLY